MSIENKKINEHQDLSMEIHNRSDLVENHQARCRLDESRTDDSSACIHAYNTSNRSTFLRRATNGESGGEVRDIANQRAPT
jgi:hypothetical protein